MFTVNILNNYHGNKLRRFVMFIIASRGRKTHTVDGASVRSYVWTILLVDVGKLCVRRVRNMCLSPTAVEWLQANELI